MLKKLRTYLKNEYKELLIATLVAFLIIGSFLIYLKFLGIPMTRARNFYNKAVIAYENDDIEKSKGFLTESLNYWEDRVARELLNKINQKNTLQDP